MLQEILLTIKKKLKTTNPVTTIFMKENVNIQGLPSWQ